MSLPLMQRGVRLEVLKDILSLLSKQTEQNAMDVLKRHPTPGECIVHGLVKLLAKDSSYSEYLKSDPKFSHLVGEVSVFVSHAWASGFEQTVDAIEEFEESLPDNTPTCFYFVDFFSVNQHHPQKDLNKLGEIVKRSQKLLLMASPWESPATLKRAWVVFELANAVIGGTDIFLSMPSSEKLKFKEAVEERMTSGAAAQKFLHIFSDIDSKSSKASLETDLLKIRTFIADQLGGFDFVDRKVANALRLWVGGAVKGFCETYRPKNSKMHASFLLKSNHLFSCLCMHDTELKCARQALKIFEDAGDEENAEVACNHVTSALSLLGRHTEAIALEEEDLEKMIKKYGLEHKETAYARYNLAISYIYTEQWSKAETQMRAAWNYWKKVDEPMSCLIRAAQGKLARILRDSGRDLDEALRLYKELLDFKTTVWGSRNPTVLVTAVDHARCLELKGYTGRALMTYKEAYPMLLKTYGEKDLDVSRVRRWINAAEKIEDSIKCLQ